MEITQTKNVDQSHSSAFNTFLAILPAFHTIFIVIYLGLVLKITQIWARLTIEFLIIVGSVIFCVTALSDYLIYINIGLMIVTMCLFLIHMRNNFHLEPFIQISVRRPNYVTIARATINLITVVCILAVDFRIFPSRFGKSGDYGFGLMDTGVGLFVASNGVVSSDRKGGVLSLRKVLSIILSCLPLIVMGISRYFVLKLINYSYNIHEYGVHWNFFLTLAFTIIIGRLIVAIVKHVGYIKFVAVGLIIAYEVILQLGLAKYILDEAVVRDNFFTANRDGICSVIGYICIYLIAIYIGSYLLTDADVMRPKEIFPLTIKFTIISISFWILTYAFDHLFGVSRRLANIGYVSWICAIAMTMLTLFNILELVYHFINPKGYTIVFDDIDEEQQSMIEDEHQKSIHSFVPIILSAANYNGLGFFIIANILTGLVNKLFFTRSLDAIYSYLILFIYMVLVCSAVTLMYLFKIKLKFW